MIGTKVIVLGAIAGLVTAGSVNAATEVRRECSQRRPHIVEVGVPYEISLDRVLREGKRMSQVQEYISVNGMPDFAEIQAVEPEWPWETYEVRLFYLRPNIEAAFGHVVVSSAATTLGIMKFQGQITPEKRHQIDVILEARQAPPPPPVAAVAPPAAPAAEMAPAAAAPAEPEHSGGLLNEALVSRIEAAAERAAQAAEQAATDSEAAVRAADRTVNVIEKMEQSADLR
jgi:hypothetical protein